MTALRAAKRMIEAARTAARFFRRGRAFLFRRSRRLSVPWKSAGAARTAARPASRWTPAALSDIVSDRLYGLEEWEG